MILDDQGILDEPLDVHGKIVDGWNFTSGIPYIGSKPVSVKIFESGRIYPICFGALDTPYVESTLANKLNSYDTLGTEIFPVAAEGLEYQFSILNIKRICDAIGRESEIEEFTIEDKKNNLELDLRYKSVRRLVLDQRKIPEGAHFFRLEKYLNYIYVSEFIKNTIEDVFSISGARFKEVEAI